MPEALAQQCAPAFLHPAEGRERCVRHASGALGHDKSERLHQPTDLIGYLQMHLKKLAPCGDQRADQHAVETFDPDLSVEADLGQMCQAIGIVRIGLVRGHVERGFGMPRHISGGHRFRDYFMFVHEAQSCRLSKSYTENTSQRRLFPADDPC